VYIITDRTEKNVDTDVSESVESKGTFRY